MKKVRKTVSNDEMTRYLQVFGSTFRKQVDNCMPEQKHQLVRYDLCAGKTVGYISTTLGAGYEYLGGTSTSVSIRTGGSVVDELFFNAPPQMHRHRQIFLRFGAGNITMEKGNLKNVRPFEITGKGWSLHIVDSRFSFGGWGKHVLYAELFGDRSPKFWSQENAVIRAQSEVLQALTDLKRAAVFALPIGEYLGKFKQRQILVLGDFSADGRKRLTAIKEVLVSLGYDPIILDEIPDFEHYDFLQKAIAVGAVSRFIVVDDSSKSGHLMELSSLLPNRWVTVILRLKNSEGSQLTKGAELTSKVVKEAEYTMDGIAPAIKSCAEWAEGTLKDLGQGRSGLFPWSGGK